MTFNRFCLLGVRRLITALPALLLLMGAHEARCQDRATVRVEENLRAEPQGTIIGRLPVGSVLEVAQVQGNWVQVDLQGWIWTASVQTTTRGGFDLSVSASPTENLRAEPQGAILARLLEGALLDQLDDVPGWTRVRRAAWAWGPSLDLDTTPSPGNAAPSSAVTPPQSGIWWQSGSGPVPILTGPDGDTLAQAESGTELQVLARRGNWIRVRMDGWVWAPEGAEPDSAGSDIVLEVTPEEVIQNPDAFRGQVVDWSLQFVSQEEAERVRTDFYEGEPFLLTRATSTRGLFVYVAVPPERLGEVEGLIPLERIRVVGRIRTGAAVLTGNPIVDLLELTRESGGW